MLGIEPCQRRLTANPKEGEVPEGVHVGAAQLPDPEASAYRLVVTATGMTDVDWAVAAHAETAGVWVTSADDAAHCTFIHPSVHRDGLVSVAVSTGGASPAMASWLRRRVGEAVGSGLGILAELLEEARRLPDRPKGIRTAEPLRGRVRRAAG